MRGGLEESGIVPAIKLAYRGRVPAANAARRRTVESSTGISADVLGIAPTPAKADELSSTSSSSYTRCHQSCQSSSGGGGGESE